MRFNSQALLLLAFGFFLGFSELKRAWRWALMLGVWVSLVQFLRIILEGDSQKIVPEGVGSLLALAFAFIGTYVGVALRTAVARVEKLTR